ncbi:META domain-containing protein [Pararhodobacter sp.]|uniref:META domain-containing protein n=1 Tax=Pararhodobacter sp. TaxID=2127056 RepID=UPI002FDE378F
MRKLMLGLLMGFGLAACATLQPELVPSNWQFTALNGRTLSADDRVTMEFAEGRVSGVSGCNRYTGPVALGEENAIAFGLLATTRMACLGEAAEIEAAFLHQMSRIDSYRFERGALVFFASGTEVMRAQRD